jgi:hypothetical protein
VDAETRARLWLSIDENDLPESSDMSDSSWETSSNTEWNSWWGEE